MNATTASTGSNRRLGLFLVGLAALLYAIAVTGILVLN
jgi:hypothetical protein